MQCHWPQHPTGCHLKIPTRVPDEGYETTFGVAKPLKAFASGVTWLVRIWVRRTVMALNTPDLWRRRTNNDLFGLEAVEHWQERASHCHAPNYRIIQSDQNIFTLSHYSICDVVHMLHDILTFDILCNGCSLHHKRHQPTPLPKPSLHPILCTPERRYRPG